MCVWLPFISTFYRVLHESEPLQSRTDNCSLKTNENCQKKKEAP